MAGRHVNRDLLDMKTAEAILAVREAFTKVRTVSAFLENNPPGGADGDPLTRPGGEFGYTEAEAAQIRALFQKLGSLNVQPLLTDGRKLTGLE